MSPSYAPGKVSRSPHTLTPVTSIFWPFSIQPTALEFLSWEISRHSLQRHRWQHGPTPRARWAYSGNSWSIVCTVSHDALLLLRTSLRTPEKDPAHVLSRTDRFRGLELRFRNSSWGTFDTILLTCGEKREMWVRRTLVLWESSQVHEGLSRSPGEGPCTSRSPT